MIWDVLWTIPAASLLAFIGGGLILNLAPGQDVLFATACGIQGGPKAGALAGLGVGIGVLFHLALATIGLGAIAQSHPDAMQLVRYLGAAYLLWLAFQSWHERPSRRQLRAPDSAIRIVAKGALSNILNPKPVLFLLSYLPQFTRPEYGPIWQQILSLGLIFAVTGTAVTVAYGLAAGVLGVRLAGRLDGLNKIAAVIFAALALRLVMK